MIQAAPGLKLISVAIAIKERFRKTKKEKAPVELSQDFVAGDYVIARRNEQEAGQLAAEELEIESNIHEVHTF